MSKNSTHIGNKFIVNIDYIQELQNEGSEYLTMWFYLMGECSYNGEDLYDLCGNKYKSYAGCFKTDFDSIMATSPMVLEDVIKTIGYFASKGRICIEECTDGGFYIEIRHWDIYKVSNNNKSDA